MTFTSEHFQYFSETRGYAMLLPACYQVGCITMHKMVEFKLYKFIIKFIT